MSKIIKSKDFSAQLSSQEGYDALLQRKNIQCLKDPDGVEIYAFADLEDDLVYTVGAERAEKKVERKTIEELLRQQRVDIDPDVLRTMIHRFAANVSLALQRQDSVAALDCYETTKNLPGPSTRIAWSQIGIVVCDETFPRNPEFATCTHDGKPGLIKGLTKSEADRQTAAVDASIQFLETNHLVPFKILEAKSSARSFIVMPYYPMTVGSIPNAGNNEKFITQLWGEMKVALNYLHKNGFAHCDVKPENIFIASNGHFLGDHGSLAAFGVMTQSTRGYLPCELQASDGSTCQRSSASVDWWMLAITLLEKCGVTAGGKQKATIKAAIEEIPILKNLNIGEKLN